MSETATRPLAAVVRDIAENAARLGHAELRLAVVELRDEVTAAGSAALYVMVGAVAGVMTVQLLLATAILLIGPTLGWWQATVLVAFVVAMFATGMIAIGRHRLAGHRRPTVTRSAPQEDASP